MLVIYIIFLVLAIFFRNKKTYIYFKTLTSLTFVLIGIYYGVQCHNYMLIPSLLGFFIGDIMLATKLRRSFLYGMGGFFFADLWLVSQLYHLKKVSCFDFIVPLAVLLFIFFIGKHPKMHLGHYKKPIYGYGFVLALALTNSIECYYLYGTNKFLMLMIGMTFYFISDFLLMFQYFYTTNKRDYLKIAKMLLYFGGAYLIACSLNYY